MTTPTVKTDFRSRVIAFDNATDAKDEMTAWKADGYNARIIQRNGVFNVVVPV
jgi:hypothetical protein